MFGSDVPTRRSRRTSGLGGWVDLCYRRRRVFAPVFSLVLAAGIVTAAGQRREPGLELPAIVSPAPAAVATPTVVEPQNPCPTAVYTQNGWVFAVTAPREPSTITVEDGTSVICVQVEDQRLRLPIPGAPASGPHSDDLEAARARVEALDRQITELRRQRIASINRGDGAVWYGSDAPKDCQWPTLNATLEQLQVLRNAAQQHYVRLLWNEPSAEAQAPLPECATALNEPSQAGSTPLVLAIATGLAFLLAGLAAGLQERLAQFRNR